MSASTEITQGIVLSLHYVAEDGLKDSLEIWNESEQYLLTSF